jgi:rod shape-determining protein MreC
MRFIYTKIFGIFSACVVVLALVVFLQVKGWLYPIKILLLQFPRPVIYVANNISLPVKNFVLVIYNLKKISQENIALTQKVYTLQQNQAQLEQETKENEALRKELGFAASFQNPLQPCTVMAKDPFNLTGALTLNCGSGQGVKEGQAVVSQGYVVGKIILADKNTSTALLVTNSGFSTDAMISKTGIGGVARGSYGSGFILDQLPQDAQAAKGWLAVTAGINNQIPKNILIGEVGDIISNPNDLFKKVTLLSPIDFDNLEFVFVVK